MIDCLSNPSWINPQIEVLLFLQNIRVQCADIIDKFFLSITIFGEFWLPTLICAITYWCIDFKAGMYLFTLETFNALLAHFFKMLACVYRPWVLDGRIQPSELAVPYAKGYSFPSGHSAMSSSVVGGVAYLLRQRKIICFSLIFLILLIGFSRLWLGVHTPQDVVGGFTIGILLVFLVNKLINWAEENKNRYWYLIGFVNLFAVLALIYVCCFNTYRMDYINGVLLVNPAKSIYVTTVVYGYILGLINGCFLCRLFVPFDPKSVSAKIRILRAIIGSAVIIVLIRFVMKNVIMNLYAIKYAFLIMFLTGIVITFVYPIIFLSYEKLLKKS